MAPGKTKSARIVKKLSSGGKRHKWKKGQSSSSNPDSFKHRQTIKVGVGFLGQSKKKGLSLTEEALKELNDDDGDALMSGSVTGDNDDDEVLSQVSGLTTKTWASNFTNCTNASFDKVLLFSNGDSAMRKEILAVLAAVTDVLKMQGGKETETEYFAALLTVIDALVAGGVAANGNPEEGLPSSTIDTLTAATYLLSLVLRRVADGVLRKKFSEATHSLTKLFSDAAVNQDPPTSLVKSTLRCLARILRVQELAVWNESYTLRVFNVVLTLTTSSKPKVRAAAQNAVCSILRGSSIMLVPNPPTWHPATANVAKFCAKEIEESGGQRSSLATLHVFELLKEVLATFSASHLKEISESILTVVDPSNVFVLIKAFHVFHSTFKKRPSSLDRDLLARLIVVLFEYQPHLKEVEPSTAWLAVMREAFANLWRLDPSLTLSHLPKMLTHCLTFLLVNDEKLIVASKEVVFALFHTCLKNIESPLRESLMEKVQTEAKLDASSARSPLHRIFVTVESCLNFQYHAVWDHSISIVGEMLACIGDYFKFPNSPAFHCLRSMADLRETPSFSHKPALDSAIGKCVSKCGPEFALSAIPLMIAGADDDRLDFPRSWMLPVLRDGVQDTELSFFIKYFLPLSSKLYNRAMAKTKENKVAEAKTYELLQYQIWCLLPGFCTRTTDVSASFKVVAKTFGVLLQERSDIRNELMTSLRNLATKYVDEASLTEVRRFAKNYLPILFNLYTSEGEIGSSPLAVLETIRVFIGLADQTVIHSFVEKLFPKLEEADIAAERRLKLLDIAVAMTPHMNDESLAKTLALVEAHLKVDDKAVQKKCYRILEEMCKKDGGKDEPDSEFQKSHLDRFSKILVASLSSAGASSKAPRLRSLTQLLDSFVAENPRVEFVNKLIPEAAVCCNASSSAKTKMAARLFLSKATEKLVAWQSAEKKESVVVGEILEILCAGLAGTVDGITAAVCAITHLLKEKWSRVEDERKAKIFQMTLVLLQSGKKPILKHVLGLAKFLLKKSPIRDFGNNVRQLTTVLGQFSEMDKKAFRDVIRIILSVSVKTLGVDVLRKMVPECFVKVVLNVHKAQEKRAAKKKAAQNAAEEEDGDGDEDEKRREKGSGESFEDMLGDDSDVETTNDDEKQQQQRVKLKAKRTKQGGASWLEERAGTAEIVDLLDPSAAGKVLSSKPREDAGKTKGVKHDFKIAPDGRFVFATAPEDEEKGKKDGVKLEMRELLDSLEGAAAVGKKRKIRWKDEEESEDEDEDKKGKMYKAGGRGIHRPLDENANENEGGKKKKMSSQGGGFGAEYRSKKAKGDMKRKGKPDPYAYIPLDANMLNKRKVKKMQGKFRNVVGAAKKGASKGKRFSRKPSK